MKNLTPIVEELTFISYACNRDYAPHVAPERWGRLYPNVPEMEARYQAEKAVIKAKVSADDTCPECGSDDFDINRRDGDLCAPECTYKVCNRCNHQWGIE